MHEKQTTYIVTGVVVAIVLAVGGYIWYANSNRGPGPLDGFAQCIESSGAKFYGAFWCPHCQNTKKMFGSSVQYLPYVECSTPDGNGQMQACQAAQIQYYPTWVFADESRQTGELTLQQLAEKTGCQLPE